MQNFQGIIFIWTQAYKEIFISALSVPLTLFSWDIHQFVFLTWIHLRNLLLHDYFQPVCTEWKLLVGLFTPWWHFSSVYRDKIFAYNRNSFFTFWHVWWNLKPGWNSPPYNPPLRWSFLQKLVTIFPKGSTLDVWLGFECACAVCVIIISM